MGLFQTSRQRTTLWYLPPSSSTPMVGPIRDPPDARFGNPTCGTILGALRQQSSVPPRLEQRIPGSAIGQRGELRSMRDNWKRVVVVGTLLLLVGSACDRAPNAPTAPANSNPALASVLAIAITPATNSLKRGERQQFTVAVDLTSGVPPSGPLPLWTSMNPSVLSVDSNGSANAIALGEATLLVTFRGRTDSRHLQIVP